MNNNGHWVYLVTGQREYRGHPNGTRFEARHDAALQRAINRGDIRPLEEVVPALREGSYALPDDWPPQAADAAQTEAPEGASFVSEGGKKT